MRVAFVIGAAALAIASSSALADWDAAGDFSTSSNPAGVWSYGTRAAAPSTVLNLLGDSFATPSGSALLSGWRDNANNSLGTPSVYKNIGSGDYNAGALNIPAGALAFHPGPTGFGVGGSRELSVVRWTAPFDMTVDAIYGSFSGLDSLGDRDVYIVLNGTPIFSNFCTGGASTAFSMPSTSFAAGDTLDFVVGNRGSYFSDTTGLDAHITVVPAPAGLGLLAASGLVATRRKR